MDFFLYGGVQSRSNPSRKAYEIMVERSASEENLGGGGGGSDG